MTDIESLRALHEAATPGPWEETVLGSEGYDVRAPGPTKRRLRVARCGYEAWEVDRANAELIAAMRNALPDLLDELERLRGQVQRVEALADEWIQRNPEEWHARGVVRGIEASRETHAREVRAAIGGDDE